MVEKLKLLMEKHYDEVVAARHFFHENPELGFEEFKTNAKICEILDKYGIKYKNNIAKTGILAQVVGTKPSDRQEKCVLLRGDIDALPLPEHADVPYKSKVPNKMHGCGHDGHAAGLIGAALILNELKDEFSGTIKFMFQPAEETEGGALPMIKEGILENPKVEACFGCHLWGPMEKGTVGISSGPIFGAPDEFKITFKGKGGHGSRPDQANSPIVAAAHFITQANTIMATQVSPFENASYSFGSIHGGKAFNVIPSEVELVGTSRNFSEEIRDKVEESFKKILEGIKVAWGCDYVYEYKRRYPILINEEKMTSLAQKAFGKVVGDENILELSEKVMGGEDFSYLANEVPSCFVLVGISEDINNPTIHHNPYFCWEDENLKTLSLGLAQCGLDFLDS